MINPFDLRGPPFLAVYACLGVLVAIILRLVQQSREGGSPARIDTSDPYLIAYLRGGKNEAARVAAVSLIDRGLLKDSGSDELMAMPRSELARRRPIEKALLSVFSSPRPAAEMFASGAVEAACRELQEKLARQGLVPDEAVRGGRRGRFLVAALVLVAVALGKVYVALQRGHTNIEFLLMMAAVFVFICGRIVYRPRTALGDATLEDLTRLFGRLRNRASSLGPGGYSADAALLAAVFGVAALPVSGFAYAHRLFRKSSQSGGSNGGSSCGSSCSSSSDSGGSSCGGGGSGCGGCGGGGD